MTVAIADFWTLAVKSRLLSPADCQQLNAAFARVKGAANQGNASAMAEWLVAQGALSHYQAQTLMARRPGPFIFGDYCVYDRIRSKEGRLAGLYRAMHVATRHPILLYFMPPEIAQNPAAWQAAAGQVAWACWVGHPYVCECHQLLDLNQYKVIAIENLAGETAAARLAGGARFAPHDACRLAYQAALGVARLHQLGLVHGEVQPENFWLTPGGNLKLLQVPLAPEPLRGPGPLNWGSPTAKLLAAVDYAAPELAQEGRPPDALTDIYALGATLFHMLCGAPPFAGGDLGSKVARHAAEPVASLAAVGIPPQLDQVLAYMMAKDPRQRYQQATQVAESLAYFVDPATAGAAPPAAPTLPTYDQWLQQQSRVPGTAPGSIPTGLQVAAYAAAQYDAARQAARQQVDQEPDYFDPSSNAAAPFDSFAAPTPDPLAFVPAETHRPQLDLSALDLSSGGRRAATEELLENLGSQSASASSAAGDAAPVLGNLEALFDTAPTPLHSKRIATRKPASRRSTLMAIGIFGAALTVAIAVGIFIAVKMKDGSRDRADQDLALSTSQHSDHPSHPDGPKPPLGGQTSTSTTGTVNPSIAPDTKGRTTPGNTGTPETKPDVTKPGPSSGGNPPTKTDASQAVADDGNSFWASPTSGSPLELNYVASGAQVVLAVRPADILRRADGDQVLPALGPWGLGVEQVLKTLTGLQPVQIDQVIAVWNDSGNGQLTLTLIVRTQEKLAAESLLTAWGNPIAAKEGDETYYQGQTRCYYLPAKEAGNLLVVGQTAQIKEIIQSAGGTPAMSAHLERMLKDTDADRDVTLAFIPGPLFSDSQAFFVGELAALRKPAEAFFGDDVKAGMLSLHFNGNLFIEMRVLGAADKMPDAVSAQFANRARSLPDMVENALLDLTLHRYGHKLLSRFPEQLRVLAENTRNDVDDDTAVLRCYLPGVATHNLLLATELALAEQPLTAGPAGGTGGEGSQSIAQLLQKKTTLTFPRDTLEKSLQMLLDDVGVKYEILGGDLQLEGITKNQSFGLDEKDKPAGEILRKIMTLANPDGKLVYVIKPKQPGGPEMLFITTRSSATKRGDKLPPELATAVKPPPKKKP